MHAGEVRLINGKLSYVVTYYQTPSNWLTWRNINKDGKLGKKLYRGYYNGAHTVSKPIEHEITIKVDTFDLLKVEQ